MRADEIIGSDSESHGQESVHPGEIEPAVRQDEALPTYGILSEWVSAQLVENFVNHPRATASPAIFSAFRLRTRINTTGQVLTHLVETLARVLQ